MLNDQEFRKMYQKSYRQVPPEDRVVGMFGSMAIQEWRTNNPLHYRRLKRLGILRQAAVLTENRSALHLRELLLAGYDPLDSNQIVVSEQITGYDPATVNLEAQVPPTAETIE